MIRFTFSHYWQDKKFTKTFRLGLGFSRDKVVSQVTERQLGKGLVHKSFKTKPQYHLVVNLIFINFGVEFGAKPFELYKDQELQKRVNKRKVVKEHLR